MAQVGSVVVRFFASTADYTKGLATVEASTTKTMKAIEREMAKAAREEKKRRAEQKQGQAMAFGAIAAGAHLAANAFERVNKTLDEIEAGTKTTADIWRDVGESVPIFGRLVYSIGDLIFRDALKVKRVLTDIQAGTNKWLDDLNARAKSIEGEAKRGADALALARLSGVDREIKELEQQRDAEIERLAKLHDEAQQLPAGMGAQASIDVVSGQMAAQLEFERRKAEAIAKYQRESDYAREHAEREEMDALNQRMRTELQLRDTLRQMDRDIAREKMQAVNAEISARNSFATEFNARLRNYKGAPVEERRRTFATPLEPPKSAFMKIEDPLKELPKHTALLEEILEQLEDSGVDVIDGGALVD